MTDEPLLHFSGDRDNLAAFQKIILDEVQRRIDESAAQLSRGIVDARRASREAEIHAAVHASRAAIALEALEARVAVLERAVKRLDSKPRSGISGLFKKG